MSTRAWTLAGTALAAVLLAAPAGAQTATQSGNMMPPVKNPAIQTQGSTTQPGQAQTPAPDATSQPGLQPSGAQPEESASAAKPKTRKHHRVRSAKNQPQESTPEEKQQTRDLNEAELQKVEQNAASATGASASPSTNMQAQASEGGNALQPQENGATGLKAAGAAAPSANAQAQAEEDTTAQTAQTDESAGANAATSAAPSSDTQTAMNEGANAATPQPSGANSPAAAPGENGAMAATPGQTAGGGVALSSVPNAQTALASASVKDSAGQTIGHVTKVQMNADGQPSKVMIALNDTSGASGTISLDANELHYDQASNSVVSDKTSTELKSEAAEPQQ